MLYRSECQERQPLNSEFVDRKCNKSTVHHEISVPAENAIQEFEPAGGFNVGV